MEERKIVIPGEIVAKGEQYSSGDGTQREGEEIIAIKYGFLEENDDLVKIIPISGAYQPRRGNVIVGKVEHITFNGWVINIGAPDNAFLSLNEVPRFVDRDRLEEVMKIGDMVTAKIWSLNKKDINLSIKSRGLGKIDRGIITRVNPSKVPRVIGKEGSMVNLIKSETGCDITVGQNGLIWVKGEKIEDELFAKNALEFINEKFHISGLTEEITKWFEEKKNE